MKVLLTGATGLIGGAILRHLLSNPSITSVITLTRRPITSPSPKHENILVADFAAWDKTLLSQIADADAMIWALGASNADIDVNYNYPIAFQTAFLQHLRDTGRANHRFRYIHTSGHFCSQDQDATLYFLSAARKVGGRIETWSLHFAEQNKDAWQTFIIRPAGVVKGEKSCVWKIAEWVLGEPAIFDDEVGAYTSDLVVSGEEEEGVVLNSRMVQRGREILSR